MDENIDNIGNMDTDPYWRTESLFNHFNSRYNTLVVSHGTYLNVDERMFWSFAKMQPEGIKICG